MSDFFRIRDLNGGELTAGYVTFYEALSVELGGPFATACPLASWFIVSLSQTRQTVSRFPGEGLSPLKMLVLAVGSMVLMLVAVWVLLVWLPSFFVND